MQPFLKLTFLSILWMLTVEARAQVPITVLDSTNAYTQNFNSLSATANAPWVNNSTLPNWYMEAAKVAGTTITASNGSSPTGGFYNFGSSNSADRTLGSINSGTTGHYYYGVRMKNNTASTIRAFSITYTGEQWRHTKESAQKLTFSYRTSTGAITTVSGGGWTNVNTLDFTGPVKGGKPAALNGNLAANRRLKSYTITNVFLAPGSEIMFRWTDSDKAGDDHALGIDDVTIVPFNPIDFYSQPNGNLNDLNTWGTNTDGTGMKPLNFTSAYQIFHIWNSATKTINHDWIIKGFGSKAIIDYGNELNFTIPTGHYMKGEIDIMEKGTLSINNQIPPNISFIDINTTVVYGYNKGNQTVDPADYYNLTITGGGDKILSDAVTVNGTLTFTSGYINLGSYDLVMGIGTTITGANATNYVKTTGSGSLVREVTNNLTTFPIGTATTYNPAVITNNGATDNFSASVSPNIYGNYTDTYLGVGGAQTADAVSRTWVITEDTNGDSDATIRLQWNATEELPGFNRTLSSIAHFDSTAWTTSAGAAASGSGPFTRSVTGYTTFGIFGVTNPNATLETLPEPLPVVLISFNAVARGNDVELKWATATEKNNDKFVIERSLNGNNWTMAGEVKGSGTTNTMQQYSFNDKQAGNNTDRIYYRAKQVDFDGKFMYTKIAMVTFSEPKFTAIKPVDNPVQDKLLFNLNGNVLNKATLQIYTASGVLVITEILTESAALNGINIRPLPAGVYIYRITDNQQFLGSGRLLKTN